MTTSVAVVDSRGITFEPTEVTYRSIMYYLDENMVKMVTPGAATTPQPVAPARAAPPVTKPAETKPKPRRRTNKRDNKKTRHTAPDLPSASTPRRNSLLVQSTSKLRLSVPSQEASA